MSKLYVYIFGIIALIALIASVFAIFAQSTPRVEWVEQAKLVSGGKFSDDFGQAIAIDGDTAVVGAPTHYVPFHKHGGKGAIYIYTRAGNNWSLQAQMLVPDNQADSYNFFGSAVAIDSNTILIAAHAFARADPSAPIYIFTRTGSTWSLQTQLSLPEKSSPIYKSVAVDGDTAVVGVNGLAHVFRRNPATGTWFYEAKIQGPKEDYRFGGAVDIDGNTIIVGGGDKYSRGAYVFERNSDTGSWFQQAELTLKGRDIGFGTAVAIFGNTAVVGAPREYLETGSTYVFERDPATDNWSQTAKLVPIDVPRFLAYNFGASVAIDSNNIAVGSSREAKAAFLWPSWNKRGAYVFVRAPGTGRWLQQAKLLPHDYERVADIFGQRVSISGNQVIVSTGTSGRGAAYIFKRLDSHQPTN